MIHQNGAIRRDFERFLFHIFAEGCFVVNDAHRTPAKNKAGASKHRESNLVSNSDRFICRLRQDVEKPNVIHYFVTFDNLLKGAAMNGRQIVELLLERFL